MSSSNTCKRAEQADHAASNAHAHGDAGVESERNPSKNVVWKRGGECVQEVDVRESERVFGMTDGDHHSTVAAAMLTGLQCCDARRRVGHGNGRRACQQALNGEARLRHSERHLHGSKRGCYRAATGELGMM